MLAMRRELWPRRTPSGYPPGQPFPGFLRQQRKLWKARDHARRETIRAWRRLLRRTPVKDDVAP